MMNEKPNFIIPRVPTYIGGKQSGGYPPSCHPGKQSGGLFIRDLSENLYLNE
ncbi:MAG: hypothetical protein K0B52_01820 [FCB group bacterium]|nr:hypothetical protein [FCB group bacterium]